MDPLPCGDGTVAYSVRMRASSFGDLLRPRVIGPQRFEEPGHRQPADRELRRAVEERAPIDVAVHVQMEKVEKLLRKVGRLLSLHGAAPLLDRSG